MTREEAKTMAQSRDCHCVNGKDRDNNYHECIDKVFDWHEGVTEDILKFIGEQIEILSVTSKLIQKDVNYSEKIKEYK